MSGFLQRAVICVSASDNRERIDLLILAVAPVVIGIEVADVARLRRWPAPLLRQEYSGGAMNAKLRIPRDFKVRTAAPAIRRKLVGGELFRCAAADQQKALGFESGRFVQQIRFEWLAREFAAGQQIGGGRLGRAIAGGEFELRLFFFVGWGLAFGGSVFFSVIEYNGDQGFGFEFSRRGE